MDDSALLILLAAEDVALTKFDQCVFQAERMEEAADFMELNLL
jgi:hypothetical protein